ncbi:helix-turn-helix transcriptional regulator [Marivirga sp.]|uniref:helix-turn-helix domain-containing protein n=1 Tax=Marivirga sp. TaxID=2018662 RepID=UPI002D7EEC83|nr:helix-turn-helix transcriptional regulator [Marivirga sp.]HET8859289.1 helix-turn-helix transcriptional regulator [Marivirga sp.]
MSTFGEYIRNQRDKKEMTQDKLSKLLDIPYTDVSKIENGKKKFKFDKLPDLAEILNIDLQELKDLYGADIMIEQKKKYECSDKVFFVAEKQENYLRNKSAKQGNLKF